jgi:cell division protein FtsQ
MNRRRLSHRASKGGVARLRQAVGIAVRAALVMAFMAAVGFGAIRGWSWLHRSGRFSVRTIAFSGLHRANEEDLIRRGRLVKGVNIFSVDTAQASAAMEKAEWVAHARVVRSLPDTVAVDIEERQPFAILSSGGLVVIDDSGVRIKDLSAEDHLDLPILSGFSPEGTTSEGHTGPADIATALRIVRLWNAQPVGKVVPLSELHASSEAGETAFTAFCGDDPAVEVRLGTFAGNSDQEITPVLERLHRMWTELQREGRRARSIDLGNRQRPDWVPTRLEAQGQIVARRDGAH